MKRIKKIKIASIGLMVIGLFNYSNPVSAQTSEKPFANWQNLDLQKDGVFGISMEKAYAELLRNKIPKPVIVAVIDGGLDVKHEDIKNVVWINPKENPGNQKDDDKNGYVDDIHGWNFLGSSKADFEYDNDLPVIIVRKYQARFGEKDSTQIIKADLPEYRVYLANKIELESKLKKIKLEIAGDKQFLADLEVLVKKIGKINPVREDFKNFVPVNPTEAKAQSYVVGLMVENPDFNIYLNQVKARLAENELDADYHLNINYDPRGQFPDEFSEAKGRFYGNGNVYGLVSPDHGTHVAGIIAADRNNNLGIKGVADAVQLMAIRAIPDGYGLDKDEANSIRYAVDQGAKVINMSFGLSVALDRKAVEDAVNYALSKDVLFIQAAGNGNDNLDLSSSYPNRQTDVDQAFVQAFIKVGASGFTDNAQLKVSFSNYGKQSVDVFAPGLGINSTIPGNKYEAHSGTSMAAPVVSGLAAVIREYYPKLSAVQVKDIIMKTVVKRDVLKDKCVSGGVVNAYEALALAATY